MESQCTMAIIQMRTIPMKLAWVSSSAKNQSYVLNVCEEVREYGERCGIAGSYSSVRNLREKELPDLQEKNVEVGT
jgi:hypothetical protein